MTNYEVCCQFVNGCEGEAGNLRSTGTKLYSYHTVIAQWVRDDLCIVNYTAYSSTTTKHRYHLISALSRLDSLIKILKAVDVPRNYTGDLKDFIETSDSRN